MTPAEQRRLVTGPRPGEPPGGIGTIDIVATADDPQAVLSRVREVLLAVPVLRDGDTTDGERWRSALPEWFTKALHPERTDEEALADVLAFRQMTPDERAERERAAPWSLPDWLYWFEPSMRSWWWWDASVDREDPQVLRVAVVVDDWPVAVGSLVCLLYVAGARNVDVDA